MLRFSAIALLAAALVSPSVRDVHYGPGRRQTFDVFPQPKLMRSPVIFMVHGGGWRIGDKTNARFVANKVERWVPKGYVVISVDYPMLPDGVKPLEQARNVARALAAAQKQAASWGGDRNKFILMGHSAGAHLVALLASSPSLLAEAGATKPIGAVFLDSAALDVPRIMEARHFPLYDNAFGSDPSYWRATSPYHQLHAAPPPFLAVCSTLRPDSCDQADRFTARAKSLGGRGSVLREELSHEQINERLGEPGPYTEAVERFLADVMH